MTRTFVSPHPAHAAAAPKTADRAARVRHAYCDLAEEFSHWTPSTPFRNIFERSVVREVRDRLSGAGSIRIIEVGCGHGTWAQQLLQAIPHAGHALDYHGIDFAAPRIELARQRLADHPAARFSTANADTFQPASPCNLILAIEVISHLTARHYAAWLERWRTWLAPGGSVIIIDKDKFTRHSIKLQWDRLKRRLLPAFARGRGYYFPEHFGELLDTLRYPSFQHLIQTSRQLGYSPRPLVSEGYFRAMIADAPAEAPSAETEACELGIALPGRPAAEK